MTYVEGGVRIDILTLTATVWVNCIGVFLRVKGSKFALASGPLSVTLGRTMVLEVSSEFSLVAVVVIASFVSTTYMGWGVGQARKKFGVRYPTMYAIESENKEAKLFNCVQRGHQNFLEMVPFFLALVILSAIQHPRIATVVGLLFLVARILYFVDYSSGDPKKRFRGLGMAYLCMASLMGCSVSLVVHQIF